jgi:hypothetical protein
MIFPLLSTPLMMHPAWMILMVLVELKLQITAHLLDEHSENQYY